MYAIVGIGPNDIEVTTMICESKEEAEEEILLRGAIPEKNIPNGMEKEIGSKFFVSYYDGCGEVYKYIIREISFNVPFGKWNLD